MSTVTLTDVVAQQHKLNAMIQLLTAAAAASAIELPETRIQIMPGESYAGLVLDVETGRPSHHVILLPDQAEEVTWDAANEWAKARGGVLPSRQEQALLFANLKGKFEAAWYWSGEAHADEGSFAWLQFFNFGFQDYNRKSYEGRARAVRRLSV